MALERITIQTQLLNVHLEKRVRKTSVSASAIEGLELQAGLRTLTGTLESVPGLLDSCVFPLM